MRLSLTAWMVWVLGNPKALRVPRFLRRFGRLAP